jgi:microcystin degradation protein MlrC
VWCDMSDIVGAGAPGENTWLLKALVEEGPDLISYVPLCDAEAVKELWDVPLNQTVTLSVGGKLDMIYNQPYKFTGQVIFKGNAKGEHLSAVRTVVLKNQGVHLILTESAVAAVFPSFFTDIGLDLWTADIVVVKNLFPFRFRFLEYNRKTFNVVSAGTTNWDVHLIKFKNITRPAYPLDKVDSWQWEKW